MLMWRNKYETVDEQYIKDLKKLQTLLKRKPDMENSIFIESNKKQIKVLGQDVYNYHPELDLNINLQN